MTHVEQVATQQAIKLLNAVHASYKILLPTGEIWDTLPRKEEKQKKPAKARRRRRNLAYKFGAVAAYHRPYIERLMVGEVAQIPFGNFNPNRLAKAVSAWACHNWGTESHKICKTDTHVELLRTA